MEVAFFAITFEVQTMIGAVTRLVSVLGALARSVQWEYLGTFDRLSRVFWNHTPELESLMS
jgi:hypothetical protein